MNNEEIKKVLDLHKKFLKGKPDGVRADLSDANLSDANLSDANLRYANLRGANLRDADLSDADLSDADLRGANLRDANLRGANLRCANLSDANLRDANLRGANIDFSCFPLWCGGLDVNIDDTQAIQLMYHLIRNVKYSKNVSDEIKCLLCDRDIVALANRFHRVKECGEILNERDEET